MIDAAYVLTNVPIIREQLQKSVSGLRICSMPLWESNSCVQLASDSVPGLLFA